MISTKKAPRKLKDVVPAAFDGLQANFCRNPACGNFGVPPRQLDSSFRDPSHDELGAYTLYGPIGGSVLNCSLCGRKASLLSNVALAAEIQRLRNVNGILTSESCPEESCANHGRPADAHPSEYCGHGRTASGAIRKRCKRCRATLTLGTRYRAKTARAINKDIVKDLVNRGALNAILRKLDIAPITLYDRIDFIHAKMVAFEAFKLRKLRAGGRRRKHFALATDAQDHMVNWANRDRRVAIQLSTITTADNYTGFIFRSDVNFDPTVGDIIGHFAALLERDDFSVPEGLGLSHRSVLPSFHRAVGHVLRSKQIKDLPEAKRQKLLTELKALCPDFDRDGDIVSDNPVRGALVKKPYTGIAHFMLIAETLPADAELHVMLDPEGAFVSAAPVGFAAPLKDGRADLTFITFNKELTNPKKKARVAKFKAELEKFIASDCDPTDDVATIRRAFIERHAIALDFRTIGVPADWWTVPIQTMYEPDKKVGIAHQRRIGTDEEIHQRKIELLDRSSLHAVDSFFNVLRQRVSYLHRAGMSRSSGSFYNAFQPYRPDMVQKIVDIARVYFN